MSKSVLVIGAGIVGLSTAYCAARKGLDVTVVDQAGPAAGGCSYGNAGMIVPSHFVPLAAPGMVGLGVRLMWSAESPFSMKPRLSRDFLGWALRFWRAANAGHVARAAPLLRDLHLASRACLEDWAALWDDDFGLAKNGLLMLCKTHQGLDEEACTASQARALGIPAEVLTAEATAALEPGLRMDVAGSVHYPLDCHLAPERLMAALARAAHGAGVAFSWGTTVTGWRSRERRIDGVCTSGGDLSADEYVLSAGVWSTTIARGLGLRIRLQAGKGYSMTLGEPRRIPRRCALLSEARVAVTPMGQALRFGGTMELTGIDTSVDAARVRGIVKSATRYLPDFGADDFRGVPVWCGLRPCSPDGLPYVGRTASHSNLSIATGHAMMGVSLGPITGTLMAETLCGERPSIEIGMLSPDRHV